MCPSLGGRRYQSHGALGENVGKIVNSNHRMRPPCRQSGFHSSGVSSSVLFTHAPDDCSSLQEHLVELRRLYCRKPKGSVCLLTVDWNVDQAMLFNDDPFAAQPNLSQKHADKRKHFTHFVKGLGTNFQCKFLLAAPSHSIFDRSRITWIPGGDGVSSAQSSFLDYSKAPRSIQDYAALFHYWRPCRRLCYLYLNKT